MQKNNEKINFCKDLTNEDVRNLLATCGYRIDYRFTEDMEGLRKTIERVYDPKTKKERIEVCAINELQEKIFDAVAKYAGFHTIFENRFNTSIVVITDYQIYDIFKQEDGNTNKDLQQKFVSFMYEKFGEKYKACYNKHLGHIARNERVGKNSDLEK